MNTALMRDRPTIWRAPCRLSGVQRVLNKSRISSAEGNWPANKASPILTDASPSAWLCGRRLISPHRFYKSCLPLPGKQSAPERTVEPPQGKCGGRLVLSRGRTLGKWCQVSCYYLHDGPLRSPSLVDNTPCAPYPLLPTTRAWAIGPALCPLS
jgi:hypothetical protein